MAATSLSLLKGKKNEPAPAPEPEVAAANEKKGGVTINKKAPAAEQVAAAAEPAVVEAEAEQTDQSSMVPTESGDVVDVDKMSSTELDKLVKDNEVEVPEAWVKMKVAEKRQWLKDQFEEAPTEGAVAEVGHTDESQPDKSEETAPEPQAAKELSTGKEVAVTKPKPATKAGSKAAAKALHGEILGPDMIEQVVHTIENLKEDDAKGLVKELNETADLTYFKLGGVLSTIQEHGWFAPHASFREFVENEHGIAYRKAMYWIDIYNKLSEKKVPWEKVKALGWTKLKEIVSVLQPENVDEWVKIASGQTTLQLIETVKNKNAQASQSTDGSDQASATVTTKTFKVHDDQKKTIEAAIAKSKEVSGTASDTVAIENICLDFLGGAPKTAPAPDLRTVMKGLGWEKTLEAFGEVFPTITLEVGVPE